MIDHFKKYLQAKIEFTDEQFEEIAKGLKAKTFRKNELIQDAGTILTHAFFVCSGLLRAYSVDSRGKKHIIQFAPENWFIGDRNNIKNLPSRFIIDAIETTEVIVLPNDFFEQSLVHVPEMQAMQVKILHNAMLVMQNRINLLLSATAKERYVDFMNLYPGITLRVPQWMIASYLGITPESLSRVRKDLVSKTSIL